MIVAGIDAGSRTIKVVLLETKIRKVLASGIIDQGVRQDELAVELFEKLSRQIGVARNKVKHIVATGYGRNRIAIAERTITEITCHAVGVCHLAPDARSVVDIGGQDSKFITLDSDSTVRDFAMNDRCAAGTGRFLEVVADRLGFKLQSLGSQAENCKTPAVISSVCVVFAETEIVGLLASGKAPDEIVAGVQTSIASRVSAMCGKSISRPVYFTGGVALVSGMDRALAKALGCPVTICPNPQMTGALGAAILASRQ